jgi:hypothetical protein
MLVGERGMSKYDDYWQNNVEAILGLLDEARTKGESTPLDLAGLDEFGERQSWYGRLDLRGGQATYAPTAPLASLGKVLSPRLPDWAIKLAWRITLSQDRKLTLHCLPENEPLVIDEADTKKRATLAEPFNKMFKDRAEAE